MTYPTHIHPTCAGIRSRICASRTTFVLLPSLDRELCVAETIRRQIARPFGRSREREEAVIRDRYATYMAIAARKIETMRPPAEVAGEIARCLPLMAKVV
jgi:shikimate kinase